MRALVLGLLFLAPTDDTVVEVLSVRNRPAADLVEVVQPLTGPGGSVAAFESRLVVKATPGALRQIREVVAALDVAPRSLWINVRHTSASAADARGGAVAATLPVGGAKVEVSPDGARVTTTSTRSQTRVTGAFGSVSAAESGSDVQRLQCLEGRPAFIRVGRAEPVAQAGAYVEADIGFWVVPRLAGESVSLDLATSRDAFEASGAVAVRRTSGSVSGRLGEWIPVGGSSLRREAEDRSIASRATATTSSEWTVELRVEAADAP